MPRSRARSPVSWIRLFRPNSNLRVYMTAWYSVRGRYSMKNKRSLLRETRIICEQTCWLEINFQTWDIYSQKTRTTLILKIHFSKLDLARTGPKLTSRITNHHSMWRLYNRLLWYTHLIFPPKRKDFQDLLILFVLAFDWKIVVNC